MSKSLEEKLYEHPSFMILAVWAFVGLIAGIVFLLRSFSDSASVFDFALGINCLISAVIAGIYCKIIDDKATGFIINRHAEGVPDKHKESFFKMFPKRFRK